MTKLKNGQYRFQHKYPTIKGHNDWTDDDKLITTVDGDGISSVYSVMLDTLQSLISQLPIFFVSRITVFN